MSSSWKNYWRMNSNQCSGISIYPLKRRKQVCYYIPIFNSLILLPRVIISYQRLREAWYFLHASPPPGLSDASILMCTMELQQKHVECSISQEPFSYRLSWDWFLRNMTKHFGRVCSCHKPIPMIWTTLQNIDIAWWVSHRFLCSFILHSSSFYWGLTLFRHPAR